MSYNFTCKDCPDREPECHSKCEQYKREKEVYEEQKRQERIREGLNSAENIRQCRIQKAHKNYKHYMNGGGYDDL